MADEMKKGARPRISLEQLRKRPKPEIEEVTADVALKVLQEQGLERVIQIRRDPDTKAIIELVMRE